MARYTIGVEKHYRNGKLYQSGDEIERPDDEKPSRTFLPLDAPAKAAFKKHFPEVRWDENRIEAASPDDTPATMSQAQKGKRAADREPV